MSFLIVFGQMSVLFAMIFIGFFVSKKGWVDDRSSAAINKLVVNVFNPLLIISGAIGKERTRDTGALLQNLLLAVLYFVLLLLIGAILVKLLRIERSEGCQYRMMLVFSNVGFMGIPVVRGLLGNEAVLFVTFYIMAYNLLIYTYGIAMVKAAKEPGKGFAEGERKAAVKAALLNTGVISSVISVVLYFSGAVLPAPVETFINYMGNTTIPLSMMAIGCSLAGMKGRELFGDPKTYLFCAIKMFTIPILAAVCLKCIPLAINDMAGKVFLFMLAMPVGSMVPMICQLYGKEATTSSRGTVLTTLVSLVSIPVVTLFF